MNNTNPNKKRNIIIICIAAVVVLIAVGILIYYLVDYSKGRSTYEDISSNYTTEGSGKWYNMLDVDIAKLKETNPDTRGWLFFENEDISYPIVQANDDEKYLNTSFEGQPLRAGTIFLEALNKGNFSDTNSIIYGHNMRDQSMFGKLQKYKNDDDYYKDHQYFQVITDSGIYRFKVFAFNDVSDTSDVYTLTFASNKEYVDFIKDLKEMSQVNIDVPDVSTAEMDEEGKILTNYKRLATLSTCTSRDDMRFVVIGDLVGVYDRINHSLLYDSVEPQQQ